MAANTDTVENSTVLEQLAFDTKTAKRVAWSDWAFTIVAPFEIEVQNLSYGHLADDHTYRVMIDEQGVPVSCTCPGFEYHHGPNGRVGKHMLAVATVGGPTLLEAARAFSPSHGPTGATETTTASKKLKADGGRSLAENSINTECIECAGLSDLPCFDCYSAGQRELPE
ncbi:SWIM zinc finger domain-containing protein [Halorubrum ezzemoulense]|uniref:SWIM zinc finger family protein n=1 Tax=Halorubrum ezzemoulense TaxID=337243 RepID=UPI00232EA1B2|nr:SWIM zinc finger family protein [Halorubrum ezzemoulense]MDB9249299.1 SWIM zinc finger domain-containing protein [Halorubrum ezzemoulense]MDB9259545.1 SWIM zinc finger domain-containing protein [Halorubrum ezzemoulense]MDB9263011.1 SWIM zinc finger domain-containing protein [Halorubrum ezzemoulense]MDB9266559.1 SWIM zinc finger domain-containing protein [Halorubrum ezzemoulense]MDB9269906.1 SWIM zinc finger domain-containing protein [Halorubrum ezzemoulense]